MFYIKSMKRHTYATSICEVTIMLYYKTNQNHHIFELLQLPKFQLCKKLCKDIHAIANTLVVFKSLGHLFDQKHS